MKINELTTIIFFFIVGLVIGFLFMLAYLLLRRL